jgi:phospholipid/cholesterol/gamma-HCH transport system substrate-binding protein
VTTHDALSSSRARTARITALGALAIAIVVVVVLLLSGGPSYTLHAQLVDASGLVSGDSVELGGVDVGSVGNVGVTPNGLADATLSITDTAITPLHRGARITVRALGQAGLTNHYVALSPGPAAASVLPSGSVLPTTQSSGLVNYDEILDSFGPQQRSNLQLLLAHSDLIYAGSGAKFFSQMLAAFDPALVELNGFTGQLADDRAVIANVIHTGAVTASAIASRSPQLVTAIQNTATTLRAVASQNRALADDFARAPAVLQQASRTLADAGRAVNTLRPALSDVPPAAGPLTSFLGKLDTTLPAVLPVVSQLRGVLPDLRSTLLGLQTLKPIALEALGSAANALRAAKPIVTVFRYYGSDLLLGVFAGLAGLATANYDRWGHYARLEFTQPYQTSLGGPFSNLLSTPLLPSLFNLKTRLLRRCPGGNAPPAPDGSSPWVLPSSICTASQDVPLSVDFP